MSTKKIISVVISPVINEQSLANSTLQLGGSYFGSEIKSRDSKTQLLQLDLLWRESISDPSSAVFLAPDFSPIGQLTGFVKGGDRGIRILVLKNFKTQRVQVSDKFKEVGPILFLLYKNSFIYRYKKRILLSKMKI